MWDLQCSVEMEGRKSFAIILIEKCYWIQWRAITLLYNSYTDFYIRNITLHEVKWLISMSFKNQGRDIIAY